MSLVHVFYPLVKNQLTQVHSCGHIPGWITKWRGLFYNAFPFGVVDIYDLPLTNKTWQRWQDAAPLFRLFYLIRLKKENFFFSLLPDLLYIICTQHCVILKYTAQWFDLHHEMIITISLNIHLSYGCKMREKKFSLWRELSEFTLLTTFVYNTHQCSLTVLIYLITGSLCFWPLSSNPPCLQ